MGIFKKVVAMMLALLMLCTLFIPAWATETETETEVETTVVQTEVEVTEEPTTVEEVTTTEAPTTVIESVIINPERVMDYSKMYHLATVTLKECSKVKWYLLKEDGSLFNAGSEKEHHGATYEILWNALDVNGNHPAGAWNAPATLRLSLVIVATGINGEEEYAAGWFTYSWYDNECSSGACPVPATTEQTAPAATTAPATAAPAAAPAQNSDVPHTGL